MFDALMDSLHDPMIETWRNLVRIPSPRSDRVPGGDVTGNAEESVRDALLYALDWARSQGLEAHDGGTYGFVQWGVGECRVDVVTHVDVFPVEGEWTYPPFGGDVVNDEVYGRGAIDNKGPLMCALWALALVRACGITPTKVIRVVIFTDIESGGNSVQDYLRHHGTPVLGFSTDGGFATLQTGAGAAAIRLRHKADADAMLPAVVHFESGTMSATVPSHAYAVIECHSETAAAEWEGKLMKESRNRQLAADMSIHGSRLQLAVHGIATHAALGFGAVNALDSMVQLLAACHLANASMWRFLSCTVLEVGHSGTSSQGYNGSPAWTCTPVFGELDNNSYAFLFDIRYSNDQTLEAVISELQGALSDKWSFDMVWHRPPFCAPISSFPEQPVTREFSEGDTSLPWVHWGSFVPNTIPYGPLAAGEPLSAHEIDEHWSIASYFRCMKRYAEAFHELNAGSTLAAALTVSDDSNLNG